MGIKKKVIDGRFLYVFLLPLFFLFHAYNENFGLISISTFLQLFLFYVLVIGGLILVSLLFLKKEKAIIFSFYLCCVFFLFGAVHDFLKSLIPNKVLTSYSVLLPLLFISTICFFFYLKRKKENSFLSMRFFYYQVIVFVILEVSVFLYNQITDKALNNDLSFSDEISLSKECSAANKPDIFFVVLDGYTSSQCLKEEFNYENATIDSLFIANHFFVSGSSKSNYNVTPFSLSSTMNFNYLRSGLGKHIVSSKTFLQAMETFKKNSLVKFLKREGYDIKNYGCFDLEDAPTETIPYFKDLYYAQIDDQTFLSRLQRDIGWNFSTKNLFTGTFKIPENYKKNKSYHLYRNSYNWNGLTNELGADKGNPKFVYVHLMLPHEPFYLDSTGVEVSDTSIIQNSLDLKEGYLNQVKYCNTLLKELILLVSRSDKSKVVIIEGDHGYRFYDTPDERHKEFMNLNAYYFSDKDYSKLYDGISPVNSFRVVLNKYFCQSLPILKDSSVYLKLASK